jgi:high-affinity Fe2+/Pb2+ permease
MSFAPFIDGSYAVTTIFLIGIGLLTFRRYRRAAKPLKAVEVR